MALQRALGDILGRLKLAREEPASERRVRVDGHVLLAAPLDHILDVLRVRPERHLNLDDGHLDSRRVEGAERPGRDLRGTERAEETLLAELLEGSHPVRGGDARQEARRQVDVDWDVGAHLLLDLGEEAAVELEAASVSEVEVVEVEAAARTTLDSLVGRQALLHVHTALDDQLDLADCECQHTTSGGGIDPLYSGWALKKRPRSSMLSQPPPGEWP